MLLFPLLFFLKQLGVNFLTVLQLLQVVPQRLLHREGSWTEDVHNFRQAERLFCKKFLGKSFDFLSLLLEKGPAFAIALTDNTVDLLVDNLVCLLGELFLTSFLDGVVEGAKLGAETVLRYHAMSNLSALLEVVGGSSGDSAEEDLFGNATS